MSKIERSARTTAAEIRATLSDAVRKVRRGEISVAQPNAASLRVDCVAMSSWYDAWADRYEDWSPSFTADVPFYVGLARMLTGHWSSLQLAPGALRSRLLRPRARV